jgi:hypothetical protein
VPPALRVWAMPATEWLSVELQPLSALGLVALPKPTSTLGELGCCWEPGRERGAK